MKRFVLPSVLVVLAAAVSIAALQTTAPAQTATRGTLPARLGGAEFATLVANLSEPDGFFRTDNLVSNETSIGAVIPELLKTVPRGGVYMGVGPEQNFTYIAALRPAIAFIVDIRRGNLQEHLMYKAVFELSANRAEFVARLFSRKTPAGLATDAPINAIFSALARDASPADENLFRHNAAALRDRLTGKDAIPVSKIDLTAIEVLYRQFFDEGPAIHYSVYRGDSRGGPSGFPSFADVVGSTDDSGTVQTFLASEERFTVVKQLQEKNLIVPVVGDFAGPKAIRAIGKYARDRGAHVSAFYLSNVEQYLAPDDQWPRFCASVASLPAEKTSTIIRSQRGGNTPGVGRMGAGGFSGRGGGGFGRGGGFRIGLANLQSEVRTCPAAR